MKAPILEAQDLHYTYPGGHAALQGISLKIRHGRRVAILGANGAGKTTLFLCLNGLFKAAGGYILLDGVPATYGRKASIEWRRRVGLVFQNPDDQIVAGNVLQDVAYGPRNLGFSPEESRQKAREALAALNLTAREGASTHELSFGARKLVAIAGVLAMQPDVMILDEPTSGIDPEGAKEVLTALEHIRKDGTTLLISTHDMDLAYEWADDVVIMAQGQTLRQGSTHDIFLDSGLLQCARLRQPWQPAMAAVLQKAGLLPADACPRSRFELLQAACTAHRPEQQLYSPQA